MRVNANKIQLLCISANSTSNASSYIRAGTDKIFSSNNLKILGFVFGETPSVKYHIEYMLNKARRRLWTLRHCKKAGLCKDDLLNVFNVFIRPLLEYAAPTFHPMLNGYLKDQIEQIQKRACKMIFGWQSSYDQLVSEEKIVTLSARREILTKNVAKKAASSARFGGWFPQKDYNGVDLRRELKYEENYARTERL